MNFYFAPMEGITGYIYRRAYHSCFYPMDKYFTPFIAPKQDKTLNSKEKNDILPEHNEGMRVVPQILTNRAEDFIRTAEKLREFGYQEVNLNLGCPSATVVSKKKGSGFLGEREALDRFLENLFENLSMDISIKTRLGMDEPEEFYRLLEIFNKYPLKELIIHPRVQADYYRNSPDRKVFADALKISRNSVVYNGDIFSEGDYEQFTASFPETGAVMLGRGILANPGLPGRLCGKKQPSKQEIKQFLDRLVQDYREVLSGERDVLFRMKELWFYLGFLFTNPEKYVKKINKAQRLCDYEEAVRTLFREQELAENGAFRPSV